MAKKKKRRKGLRLCGWMFLILTAAVAAAAVGSRALILGASAGRTYSDPAAIPENRVGLVLGCVPQIPGRGDNLFFVRRMDAAAELFRAGKVQYLLVSGDNHVKTYDEPAAMRAALIERGVPEDRIVCDYAGLRTLDSVVRARAVFGQNKLTIISQPFHNQRAIFIASRRGIDAVGFNAADVHGAASWKTALREHLARIKAVLDVTLLNRQPRHLGEPIEISKIDP